MNIFDKFYDTVFLKEDSDLINQLSSLKEIRNKIPNKDEIDKDIKLLEYGIQGEKDIAFELKNAHLGLYILHDVTYEIDGVKAQIDYLIFSKGYFYLIECKNLYGNITVDNNAQFYREFIYNGKTIKESIYSPLTQVVRHQDIMKKVWNANHNKLERFVFGIDKSKDWFKPLVVLSNSKCYLNTKYAPKEIKNNIIRADQLINYIKKDLETYDKDLLGSEKQLKEAAKVWLSRSIENKTNIAEKYINKIVNKKDNRNLYEELRKYRKEKSQKMNVPAYYIFNDEEMENIIKNMPKNINELKSLKILSNIKVKCHGEEIIEIINR